MIRHSSSFFLSLVIHLFLGLGLFFTYSSISKVQKNVQEPHKRVKIQLCHIKEKKVIPSHVRIKEKIIIPKILPDKEVTVSPKKHVIKPPKKIIKKVPKKEKITPPKVIQKETMPTEKTMLKEKEIIKQATEKKEEVQVSLEQKYINNNIQKITQLLQENLYYPRSARKRGITGNIIVSFTLSTSGEVHSIKIIESHSDILSRAAIKTIQNISEELPKPKEELILQVPISYSLSR